MRTVSMLLHGVLLGVLLRSLPSKVIPGVQKRGVCVSSFAFNTFAISYIIDGKLVMSYLLFIR